MEYVLGTANLGLAYGTALRRELPDEKHVFEVLDRALGAGFSGFDTAAAYGLSEHRIGRYLAGRVPGPVCVSTKPDPRLGTSGKDSIADADRAVAAALASLGRSSIDQFLLHRWAQYGAAEGQIWSRFRHLAEAGTIGRLGVSVQSPNETRQALRACSVEAVQLACNILDWRYETPDVAQLLQDTKARIEIRSVFLQGLLTLADGIRFPRTPEPYSEAAIRTYLDTAATALTGGDPVALCLRYAASLNWADALVLGADSPAQVDEIARILTSGPFTDDQMRWLRSTRPHVPESLLDPSQWL